MLSINSGCNFHFASGFLFKTPKPLHGASIKTLSAFSVSFLITFVESIILYSILKAPFLLALSFSCFSLLSYKSIAINCPLFSIKEAKCKVFPPAPAQVSTTRIPGSTSRNAATSCELASCTSNIPSLKASVRNTFALSFNTKASG